MESNIEILVIDDHIDTAQSYSDLITTQCKFQSIAMSNIESAIKCVSENPIKIVVLDQRMPIPGSEVFIRLKKINPYLKIVMVTGEASAEEVLKADTLGYAAKLHKNDIVNLPEIIFRLYAEYENGITQIVKSAKPFHRELKFSYSHIGYIKYYLLDYRVVSDDFTKITEWKTLERINQGEKQNKEVIIELKITDKIRISEDFKIQLKNTKKIFLSNLDIALDTAMSLSNEIEKTRMEITKRTTELSLRNDEMIDGRKVLSKNYETNQVYKQILLHIKKECSFCGEHITFPLMIYKPINRKIYRQKCYTEDNKDYVINTGDFTW